MGKDHKAVLRKSFAKQAESYSRASIVRHAESAVPMIELSLPTATDRVLDAACRTGFVALAFAPLVQNVVGVDLSKEMVRVAERLAAERGCKNVEFQVGDVEDLKFGTGSFDIVTSRFTFHHFENQEKALFEMKRVLTPGGRIVLHDVISSADDAKAEVHNAIEKQRDPAHVRMLQLKECEALFKKVGLEVRSKVVVLMKRDFDAWMDVVGADEKVRKKVRTSLTKAEAGDKAGLGIRVRERGITFTQTNVIWLLGPKP